MPYTPNIASWPTQFGGKLPVVEIFYSLQGEGRYMGTPAVFIRLKYCNLGCAWCDTRYTWDSLKLDPGELLTAEEVANRARSMVPVSIASGNHVHAVITGGEPMLHQDHLPQLIGSLREMGFGFIEVETNGMFTPTPELTAIVDWWNCSPKLSNNLMDPMTQIVPDALRTIAATGKADFKFVLQAPEEIREIVEQFAGLIPPDRVMIMPEGQSCSRQLNAMSELAEVCLKYGFRLSPRLHTLIWDNERGR